MEESWQVAVMIESLGYGMSVLATASVRYRDILKGFHPSLSAPMGKFWLVAVMIKLSDCGRLVLASASILYKGIRIRLGPSPSVQMGKF